MVSMISQGEIRIVPEPSEMRKVASQRTQSLLSAGSMLGAVASMSCCIVPLVLFGLGVSGAWIGNLTQLAPYQPYFIAGTMACLAAAIGLSTVPVRTPAPMAKSAPDHWRAGPSN